MAFKWAYSSIVIVLLLQIMFTLHKVTSNPTYMYHFCFDDITFTTNSQYHTNLNTVFRSLSTNATANPTGFFSASAGTSTNQAAYGFFLCRGDQNVTACKNCVATATSSDLPNKYCPNITVGVIWYEECMVRYSNTTIISTLLLQQYPSIQLLSNKNITGNKTRFIEVLGSAMNDVRVRAANGLNGKKYATNIVNVTRSMKLYTLGQCTPDLAISDCNLCLRVGIGKLQIMVDGSILMPNCIIRYATYPFFYDGNDSLKPSVTSNMTTGARRGLKKKASSKVIIAIVVPILVIALLGLLYIAPNRSINYYSAHPKNNADIFTTVESLQYDLVTLQVATNYFSQLNKLGQGGFGTVYKGTLQSGEEIAVKRLSIDSGQAIQEFKNEVLLVAKLQHRNLARLLGFCVDGQEKLLVYEYLANKSLNCFLFDDAKRTLLNWEVRFKIIIGIARGMVYLHQDSRPRIIHRDLKVSNILLDIDMNPKVADFGMARMFSVDQSLGNTQRIAGTYGYMSPEYAMLGQFSVKSDVYSFGVLILEIIYGKGNSTFYETGYAEDLISYVWKKWKDGVAFDTVDPIIKQTSLTIEVMRCIQIGLLCVQKSPRKRPTMATIVHKLDARASALPLPQQPALFSQNRRISDPCNMDLLSDCPNENTIPWSVNDMSITDIDPR